MMQASVSENHVVGKPIVATIGGYNFDFLIESRIPANVLERIESTHGKVDIFQENRISNAAADYVLSELHGHQFARSLGGAAFHTTRGLLKFSDYIDVRPMGIVPSTDQKECHHEFLRRNGANVGWIQESHSPAANSFSFKHDGGRTLLTSVGSNRAIGNFLSDFEADLHSSRNRISALHANSFLDQDSQIALRSFICNFQNQNPNVTISYDPGSGWHQSSDASSTEILKYVSILHCNEPSFAILGGRLTGESDRSVSDRIFAMMRSGSKHLILRRDDTVSVFSTSSQKCEFVNDICLYSRDRVNQLGGRHSFDPGEGQFFGGILLANLLSPALAILHAADHASRYMKTETDC